MQTRAYFEIGGTGARADAVSIWIAQFVGQAINVLDYEAQGQPPSVHVDWMRSRGYGKAYRRNVRMRPVVLRGRLASRPSGC